MGFLTRLFWRRWIIGLLTLVTLAVFASACQGETPSQSPPQDFKPASTLAPSSQISATRTATPTPEYTPTPEPATHISELLKQSKVEVLSSGVSISSVVVRVRSLVEEKLRISIPAGTFFISSDTSAQNMVARHSIEIELDGSEWVDMEIPAACANLHRDVPEAEVSFEIRADSGQPQLDVLMPLLEQAGVDYAVEQAAVWIVSDDADYGDLGILRSRSALSLSLEGERMINVQEVAAAMRILDQAGIDITAHAIWEDRDLILARLEDEELKDWIHAREAVSSPPSTAASPTWPGLVLAQDRNLVDMAFSPSGLQIAATRCGVVDANGRCTQGEIVVWDARTGQELAAMPGHATAPHSIAWSPDGQWIASGACVEETERARCNAAEIIVWEAARGKALRTITGAIDWVTHMDFSADGKFLLAPQCSAPGESFFDCFGGEIFVWEVASGQLTHRLAGDIPHLPSMALSPDGRLVAADRSSYETVLWDLPSGRLERVMDGFLGSGNLLRWSPDGRFLAIANVVALAFFEVQSGARAGDLNIPIDENGWIYDYAWSPDASALYLVICHTYDSQGSCISGDVVWYDITPVLAAAPAGWPLELDPYKFIRGLAAISIEASPIGSSLAIIDDNYALRILSLGEFD